MKQLRRKLMMTLVALLAVTTQAWADDAYPIVYDFEAAANAGENPDNKNGSAANGQKFYGWEKDDKKDEARQDYKGYEYADGSVLPEVCHVWRRSDRFPDNVAGNGGLKCPSNKEMAVDGLTEGLTVTIIYDATNAAEGSKEIVWAIGDGSSESLGEPRAKAIINGAEAVPGTTTIKSGDVITVTKVTPAANGSGYIVFGVKKGMVIKKIIIDVAPTVALTRGTGEKINEWTMEGGMPAGNVEVNVTYYPQATADGAVTATDAQATTDAPLVTIDETKLTGASGLMYFVSETETAPDYDAQGWTDQVPNAKDYTEEKTLYVWYYPIGADGTTDADIYSDGDMNARALPVNVLPEPTYNVEFAEGTDPNEWSADPNTGVKKGQTVTVTYTGTRKVIGVKAEKKGAAGKPVSEITPDDIFKVIASNGKIYDNIAAAESAGTVAQGLIVYVGSNTENENYNHGLALALNDENDNTQGEAINACNAKNTSTPIVDALWILPSQGQWNTMFNAAGGDWKLRDCFSSAGGNNMVIDGEYWSSTGDSEWIWYFMFSGQDLEGTWGDIQPRYNYVCNVRACIVF